MQISSENYIAVLTEQVKALTIENAQLKAHILDLEAKAKEDSDGKTEKSSSQPAADACAS
jgi:cell division protein FtsB